MGPWTDLVGGASRLKGMNLATNIRKALMNLKLAWPLSWRNGSIESRGDADVSNVETGTTQGPLHQRTQVPGDKKRNSGTEERNRQPRSRTGDSVTSKPRSPGVEAAAVVARL